MKYAFKHFFALGIILSFMSCDVIPDEDDFSESLDEPLYTLNQLLLKAVPLEHKPNRVTKFQLDTFLGHTDIYYDSMENELFYVSLNETLDTTNIVLNVYSDGLLVEKNAYPKNETGYSLNNIFEYLYNSDRSLHQIVRKGEIYFEYKYNDKGLVSEIIFGPIKPQYEGYFFYYDENDRITRQIWCVSDQKESPIRDWHYIYDQSGKLLSKSIPVFNFDNLKPMFVYSYDNQNRMIEELELYPEYGFSSYFKTIYSYSQPN